MRRRINHIVSLVRNASRKQLIIGAVILIILGYLFFFRGSASINNLITVERGTVKQEINVTGSTKPFESVNLAFEQSGRIAEANVRVGSRVSPGQVLARLDQGQLLAERAGQQANAESAQATLDEMRKGSRPEDIQIKQAALATANQNLDSEYQEVLDTLNDAYIKADDAVRKQLDSLFTNDEESNVQISFAVTSAQVKSDLENGRLLASTNLANWKKELDGLSSISSKGDLDRAITSASQKLSFVRDFLGNLMNGLNTSISSSNPQIETYKTNVNTARTNVNAALTSVNSATQDIATQKLTVKQSEADLNKTLAGNTPESINAQAAKVKQAEAQVQATDAQIQKTILRAPFFGVVTKQDAKVGEIASPNTPVISLISEGKLEIEANVAEADIGKVMVGNSASMTIDAFPGETFSGKVGYIDPAETIVGGITNFKTKIAFDKNDPRLKSGLTTNISIKTLEKMNVLVLPQYALIENSDGVFIDKKQGEKITRTPITIGIRSHDGKVEILSGVSEGDVVVTAETNPAK